MHNNLRGLYVLTDRKLIKTRGMQAEQMVEEAILGGARIVQYRNKQSPLSVRKQEAMGIARICREHRVTFLVNDDIEVAIHTEADGVHLGQTDMPLQQARQELGTGKIIGITCHNDLQLARNAEQHGADYVAFGRFYPSRSKPGAPPASIDTLVRAHQELAIPVCAIGGITINNARNLIDHGADMIAVINEVLGAADIRHAATSLAALFRD